MSSSSSSSSASAKPPCVRQGLPDCAQDTKEALAQKVEFVHRLQRVKVKREAVERILQKHSCRQPLKPFQEALPKAEDVTALEASVAYAYAASPSLAQEVNRLFRAQNWAALFSEYGQVVHCLVGYIQKVEKAYAAKRTLYRGTRMPESYLRQSYVVGQVVTWAAFASASSNQQKASAYARESYDRGYFASEGIPVMFVVHTYQRGAVLGDWTPHSTEHELLLMPFLCFEVTSIREATPEEDPSKQMQVVTMQAVKTPRSCRLDRPDHHLLFPVPWPWPGTEQAKEVLSELEEDGDEELKRKLEPPGAVFLAALVAILSAMMVLMCLAGFDLDDISIDYLLS